MGILDWLFKQKAAKTVTVPETAPKPKQPQATPKQPNGPTSRDLSLEGTRFRLFTVEEDFFEECRKSGQAALAVPFAEFWPVNSRGYEAKAIGGGTRLLCGSCLVEMAQSFEMSLPGGMFGDMFGGRVAILGGGLPSNVHDSAKAARCPHCGSEQGILLWDHPQYGDITERDMEALRDLWRFRCQVWWSNNNRSSGICDRCNSNIPRGEGYHVGSEVICEECAVRATDSKDLYKLRKDPNYYGTSELRRARSFKSGGWRLERGRILQTAAPSEDGKEG